MTDRYGFDHSHGDAARQGRLQQARSEESYQRLLERREEAEDLLADVFGPVLLDLGEAETGTDGSLKVTGSPFLSNDRDRSYGYPWRLRLDFIQWGTESFSVRGGTYGEHGTGGGISMTRPAEVTSGIKVAFAFNEDETLVVGYKAAVPSSVSPQNRERFFRALFEEGRRASVFSPSVVQADQGSVRNGRAGNMTGLDVALDADHLVMPRGKRK